MRIAVVGASGFVGNRIVEQFVLGGYAEVVPVVRSFSSLAVLSRFDLPSKVCDVLKPADLAAAFSGCDTVIHAALGDPGQIVAMAKSIYTAATTARVKRLIVLSSAAVHGLNPAPGTDETTPISDRQTMDYNNAKVRAERTLLEMRQKGKVELVLLRPGIVYGPRCRLFAGLAEKLLAGTAYLINEGRGICNGIYVDNLVDAIRAAIECGVGDREAFLLGDSETVTWLDIYMWLSGALGIDIHSIERVTPPVFKRSAKEKIEKLVATPLAQSVLPIVPGECKRLTKVVLGALKRPETANAWTLPTRPYPTVDEEMATLQQCNWKLPGAKAANILGFKPSISFSEGMRRTISWLDFVGCQITQ